MLGFPQEENLVVVLECNEDVEMTVFRCQAYNTRPKLA
jgi:hypothetical protein